MKISHSGKQTRVCLCIALGLGISALIAFALLLQRHLSIHVGSRIPRHYDDTFRNLKITRRKLRKYHKMHGRYPSQKEGVVALGINKGAFKPYLFDGWGSPLAFSYSNNEAVTVWSYGKDCVLETPDDIGLDIATGTDRIRENGAGETRSCSVEKSSVVDAP